MSTAQLPPPPLVEAETEVYSPPPLVEAPIAPPLVTAPPSTGVETKAPEAVAQPAEERRPMLGVGLDAALPDGAGVNLSLRPIRYLELHAGIAHNAISSGFRGGVTFLPADHWYVPTLTVELGTHPPGDANPILQTITGNSAISFDALRDIGYDYQNAMLGFTLGSRDRFTIYLRGGITHVTGRTSESDQVVIADGAGAGSGAGSITVDRPELWLPAIKAGFAIYFF